VVRGRLMSNDGGLSTWISPAGLLTFDNIAPALAKAIKVNALNDTITLSWSGAGDAVQYRVVRNMGERREVLGETAEEFLQLRELPMLQMLRLEIESSDSAGNWSEPAVLSTKLYPVPGVAELPIASTMLSAANGGSLRLILENSPYRITGTLHVKEGETVFVEPGVEVQMGPDSEWLIKGDAYFWGENSSPVVFSAVGRQAPKQYLTLSSKGTVVIKDTKLLGGNQGVVINVGQPSFDSVSFTGNQYSAVSISGYAAPIFQDCRFEGSQMAAMVISDYAKPVIVASEFVDNKPFHIQSSAVYPVSAEGNSWSPAASASTVLGEVKY